MSLTQRLQCLALRLGRFSGVGAACTLLNMALTFLLQFCLPLPVAAGLGFVVSGQVSFVLHSKWTYHDRPSVKLLLRWVLFTVGNTFFGLVLNRGVVAWGLHQSWLDDNLPGGDIVPRLAAYLMAFAVCWPGNFSCSHWVVFRHEPGDDDHSQTHFSKELVERT